MRGCLAFALLSALAIGGFAASAGADNNVCLAHAGNWKATGTVASAMTFQGNFDIQFSAPVVGENMVKSKSAMEPVVTGDCMVGWAAGIGELPDTCKKGSTVTATGHLSFDDSKLAGVNIADMADLKCE
jgi:hypothetical protein